MQKKIAENPHWDDGGYVYFILWMLMVKFTSKFTVLFLNHF
jgi:hypothetical protein